MSTNARKRILYFSASVVLALSLYLVIDGLAIGVQEQGSVARAAEWSLAAAYAVKLALRRYSRGLNSSSFPTKERISSLAKMDITETCRALLDQIRALLENINHSGRVYSPRRRLGKSILLISGPAGILVSIVTGTGIPAALGVGASAPGTIDTIREAFDAEGWEYWENQARDLVGKWQEFLADCIPSA